MLINGKLVVWDGMEWYGPEWPGKRCLVRGCEEQSRNRVNKANASGEGREVSRLPEHLDAGSSSGGL